MFGKGVYFADMSSKSGMYCFAKHKEQGFLLLAEVALGNGRKLKKSDRNANQLPNDTNSTFVIGHCVPDTKSHQKIDDNVLVPIGKPVLLDIRDYPRQYNEFVVYDENQIRLRYLVKVTFLTE